MFQVIFILFLINQILVNTNNQLDNINDDLPVLEFENGEISLKVVAEELIVNPDISGFNPEINASEVKVNEKGVYLTNGVERTVVVYLSKNTKNNRYKLIDDPTIANTG